MSEALIGYTGFVGSSLLRQRSFDLLYRSTNISEIAEKSFHRVICAGASAKKWLANQEPQADRASIEELIRHLGRIRCDSFVLISTVDVFKNAAGVTEETPVDEAGLHPYGLHRRLLEKFVETHFTNHLIVRLPGLVGPGLRKNVIFDLLHDNATHAIDGRAIFQFYPMVNLWRDIRVALQNRLKLIHLTAEPIGVAELAATGFGRSFRQELTAFPPAYDFQTCHAPLFGRSGAYQYDKRDTIEAIRSYVQSEPAAQASKDGGHP